MKKIVLGILVCVLLIMSVETKVNAEENNYELVKKGVEEEIKKTEENEDMTVVSVDKIECPDEKVCIYVVKIIIADQGEYTLIYYINGETEEVMAVLYDAEGEVVDYEVENLSDAAAFYTE